MLLCVLAHSALFMFKYSHAIINMFAFTIYVFLVLNNVRIDLLLLWMAFISADIYVKFKLYLHCH